MKTINFIYLMTVLLVAVIASNFIYQFALQEPAWKVALERSFFQSIFGFNMACTYAVFNKRNN